MFLQNADAIFRAIRCSRPESSNQTKPVCLIHITPHKGHTAAAVTLGTASLPSSIARKMLFCVVCLCALLYLEAGAGLSRPNS
jgi:hypothetical protein